MGGGYNRNYVLYPLSMAHDVMKLIFSVYITNMSDMCDEQFLLKLRTLLATLLSYANVKQFLIIISCDDFNYVGLQTDTLP